MLLMHIITCMWGSGEIGLGVRALGRVAEMTLHAETLCLDVWGLLYSYYQNVAVVQMYSQLMGGVPLGSSNQSLYLLLRCKGDLTTLPRNGDSLSCKLQKDQCFL